MSPRHATRRLVAASYDEVAPAYAEAADLHVYRRLAAPLVAALARAAPVETGAVVDVAAGTGAVGRHFRRAIAVDVSRAQLDHNDTPDRVVAAGERLPFRADTFVAAACGFGINHTPEPVALVSELIRVAPVVGVSTWHRPEEPFAPKQVVFDVLARRLGSARSPAGTVLDRYAEAVGSVDAVAGVFRACGVRADVDVVAVEIPWPGADAYLDYRLSMPSTTRASIDPGLWSELREALAALPPDELTWTPQIIVGVAGR